MSASRLAVLHAHVTGGRRSSFGSGSSSGSSFGSTGAAAAASAGTIERVEYGVLFGERPRAAGRNGRIDVHGVTVRVPIVRITTSTGAVGFGRARGRGETDFESLLGVSVDSALRALSASDDLAVDYFTSSKRGDAAAQVCEYAILDLVANVRGLPVFRLVGEIANAMPVAPGPLRVPCYDTSLYIDEELDTTVAEAAALIASEAMEGYERGHRAFKIKTGRGNRWNDLEEGTQKDIAVIKAVREAVGPECVIMIDANNGYNLNLTKRVLSETRDCELFWVEEAFHEDEAQYEDLRAWLDAEGIGTKIADGEGIGSQIDMHNMAINGPVDVVQYDIFSYGFMPWVLLGPKLDAAGVMSAPHHYGAALGNYYSGHLSAAIKSYARAEWDHCEVEGIDSSLYSVENGHVDLPDVPGFGLKLDEEIFQAAVAAEGGVSVQGAGFQP